MLKWRARFLQVGLVISLLGQACSPSTDAVKIRPLLVEPGDLVFRVGTGWRSEMVRARGNFALSHVGIADRLSNGDIVVIHANPGEGSRKGSVRAEPFSSFASPSQTRGLAIYRLRLSQTSKIHMLAKAWSYVDQQRPFDSDYNLSDENALYCTELVWRAMGEQHIPRFTSNVPLLNSQIILPEDLLKSVNNEKLIQHTN